MILVGFAAYGYNKEFKYDQLALTTIDETKSTEDKQDPSSIKQRVAAYTSKILGEVFASKENEKQGLTYLEKMFKNK